MVIHLLPFNNSLCRLKHFTLLVGLAAVTISLTSSCRPKAKKPEQVSETTTYVAELHQNTLSKGQSSLIDSQAASPVHWQNWDKNVFTRAEAEKKTIFVLVGSGTDVDTLETLQRLNNSPSSCALLNDHHVNVLIDSNIHPDMEYFVAMLCMKSRTPVATPLLIWFSYEGNPISWSPVGSRSSRDIDELIGRMSNTVYKVWRNDPAYVLKNSEDDYTRRMDSFLPKPLDEDTDPSLLIQRSIRQAASLFDPTSNTIDGLGNLTPSRYINLLVQASYHPDTSEIQRERYIKTACLAADNILIRGLIDPLDGGIYKGIQKTTSALPVFTKTLRSQALSMKTLYNLYQATGNDRYLAAADSMMKYTEKNLAMKDGGYILGIVYGFKKSQDNPCVWTLEEIEAALTPDEFKTATIAFGLRGLGNIPLIDDPDRYYFRKNSLTLKASKQDIASQLSLDITSLSQKLESITKKLAKLRTEKPQKPISENISSADSMAHLASAYVAGYRATGNVEYLTKSKNALSYIRQNFTDPSGKLHRVRYAGKLNTHPATASAYALVSQAALDLHEVTLDRDWLKYSYSLHQAMNMTLGDKSTHHLREYNGEGYASVYKTEVIYSLQSLDNDSSWSIAYANAKRLGMRFTDESLKTQTQN
ncbi:MAG: DUF255 domain-containing protein, partial [Verrucomicrobiae bacterium]|nr:DUF255 domain-containing protein [Verrucomicrobiae bacterium]NNJ86597.1 thioredoxin domain-containing protein [Akkermansiaceae bacterium]